MTKIPKEQQSNNDSYMALLVSLFVTTVIGCFVIIMGLMIFVNGLYHWWFIFVMPFALVTMMLPMIITTMIAKLLKLQKRFVYRVAIGIIYGILANGFFVWFWHSKMAQTVVEMVLIMVACMVIGIFSARRLPDN